MSSARKLSDTVFVDRILEPMVAEFLNNRKEDLSRIEEALGIDNWKEIERVAHILKGVCGGFGFDELGNMGVRIMELSAERKANEIRRIVRNMRLYLENVRIHWR